MRSKRILTLAEIAKMKELKGKTAFEKKLVKSIRLSASDYTMKLKNNPRPKKEYIKQWFLEESEYWKKKELTEEEFDYAWDIALNPKLTKIQRDMFAVLKGGPNC